MLSERCKRGHLLSGSNLRIKKKMRKQRDGTPVLRMERECVECHRVLSKSSYWDINQLAPKSSIKFESFKPKYKEPQ